MEPENEFDKNAIKVIANINGNIHHIGHVPKKENVYVGNLIKENAIDYINAEVWYVNTNLDNFFKVFLLVLNWAYVA
ncbi:HIRAN domain-containing protein [Bacillus massilinigeriensis]|uniref:HIRAN domain-containing protein n=1 Tax=Bacillus mediterraneensis TaxID=1805474 RepID=UPI001F310695|nr:HIRAN domain-containing protein [Bacillus mediterraneensis]